MFIALVNKKKYDQLFHTRDKGHRNRCGMQRRPKICEPHTLNGSDREDRILYQLMDKGLRQKQKIQQDFEKEP